MCFCGEELLAPCPTSKLKNHPLSAVRVCLLSVFAANLHIWRPFLHPQTEEAPCRDYKFVRLGAGVYGLDRSGSGQGQVAGSCKCGNEPSDSIK